MTRDDILEAAAQVFRQKGFHGASMANIAEAVNLQKASLYHHVSSKQEILFELLDRASGASPGAHLSNCQSGCACESAIVPYDPGVSPDPGRKYGPFRRPAV